MHLNFTGGSTPVVLCQTKLSLVIIYPYEEWSDTDFRTEVIWRKRRAISTRLKEPHDASQGWMECSLIFILRFPWCFDCHRNRKTNGSQWTSQAYFREWRDFFNLRRKSHSVSFEMSFSSGTKELLARCETEVAAMETTRQVNSRTSRGGFCSSQTFSPLAGKWTTIMHTVQPILNEDID